MVSTAPPRKPRTKTEVTHPPLPDGYELVVAIRTPSGQLLPISVLEDQDPVPVGKVRDFPKRLDEATERDRETLDRETKALRRLTQKDEIKRLAQAMVSEEREAIDPDKAVGMRGLPGESPRPPWSTLRLGTLKDLLSEFVNRQGEGHEIASDDNPRERLVGFLDYETRQFVAIDMRDLQTTFNDVTDEDLEDMPFPSTTWELRMHLVTSGGRETLFGRPLAWEVAGDEPIGEKEAEELGKALWDDEGPADE